MPLRLFRTSCKGDSEGGEALQKGMRNEKTTNLGNRKEVENVNIPYQGKKFISRARSKELLPNEWLNPVSSQMKNINSHLIKGVNPSEQSIAPISEKRIGSFWFILYLHFGNIIIW